MNEKWSYYSDIWALGVTCCELITGENVFDLENTLDSIVNFARYFKQKITKGLMIYGNKKKNFIFGVKEPLKQLILSMLQLDPISRPAIKDIINNKIFDDVRKLILPQCEQINIEIIDKTCENTALKILSPFDIDKKDYPLIIFIFTKLSGFSQDKEKLINISINLVDKILKRNNTLSDEEFESELLALDFMNYKLLKFDC